MQSSPSQQAAPFWRDERFLNLLAQALFVVLLLVVLRGLYQNMVSSLERQGVTTSFQFLNQTASFDIGETLIPYTRSDTYARAFLVGVLNTLQVSLLGIVFATLLGIVLGVARLSSNFLVNRIAALYIEIIRNIPLLVLLIFWYGVFLKMPRVKDAITLPGPIYISNRGVSIPWWTPTSTFQTYLFILILTALVAVGLVWLFKRQAKRTGRSPLVIPWAILLFLVVAILGWLVLPEKPLLIEVPVIKGLNTTGGLRLTPEFTALLSGLVIYTAAFIGETVRAGIQAISKGQTEAAKALGLSNIQILRLVIFPQALRVIVPPLTSQYLNLTKNSSLAAAIGFPDLYSVSGTIYNQTGRAMEATILIMSVYLLISLATSLFMNWYNQHARLVER